MKPIKHIQVSKKGNGESKAVNFGTGKTVVIDNLKSDIKIPLIHYISILHSELYKSGIITETQKNQIANHLLAKSLDDHLYKADVVFNKIEEPKTKFKNPKKCKNTQ